MTTEPTAFLYPFIDRDERDAGSLLGALESSAQAKAEASRTLVASSLAAAAAQLDEVAEQMAERFRRDGRLLAFGNGGSATDADAVAALFRDPPVGPPLAALSLVADEAVLTALANDVGVDVIFSRQLMAQGSERDIALGISTSGGSENLLVAFGEARRRGMLTVGLAGYDGGRMATCADVAHCLVVGSDSVHRIQEAQAALAWHLWRRVQAAASRPDAGAARWPDAGKAHQPDSGAARWAGWTGWAR